MNIGIFDSGLGGLSVFREILQKLPMYNYIYFGDNARVPYGGRSADLIYQFTKNAMDFLFKNDCKLVILACNTASSNTLCRLQREYLTQCYPDRRILGVIKPVVEAAVTNTFRRIGVMGTRATIASNSYPKELTKLAPKMKVFQEACPLLAPLIEEDEMQWEGFDLLIKRYLKPLLEKDIEGLILGCTHYELIINNIQKHLPENVSIVSQGKATAEKLAEYLIRHPEIESKIGKNSKKMYYATDLNQRYQKLTKLFLGNHFSEEASLALVNM